MKEEKIDCHELIAAHGGPMALINPAHLSLSSLMAPNSNETISIVIPLSAQLASLTRNVAVQQMIGKTELIDEADEEEAPKKPKTNPPRIKEDKTKGCPYPNCSRYGRAFSRAHDLKRHIARHDQRDKQQTEAHQQIFPCLVCGAHFYNEQILQRHKLTHEMLQPINGTSSSPHTCHFCKKTFEHESLLNAHLPIHLKTEAFGMTFSSGSRYQLSSGPPPLVPTSTAASSSVTGEDEYRLEDMLLLRKNLPNQTNQQELQQKETTSTALASKVIRCEYCSKTFKTKWTLSSHVAAHEGRFQYQCCICNKRFVRKSHYESHVRSHDAARPYVCEHCGKTFKESKHRREHLKRKHPNNRNAIQSLLDSISACVNEEAAAAAAVAAEQAKLTLLMPMNFSN
ncbi:hypothetical protein QAD02_008823 [Eretmocerus hayati]|uniref:Uncharacterized protein n=1 Tax=Eretmocerus hayati TaxID=131215 RepID=A0ACC2N7V7_9HYME|nr:hypothetical protein QAD02_008823 [Eretmocerus hayati]